jgi:hypothetical protein
MGGVYMFRTKDITHLLCSKQIHPIYGMNFQDFHRFSLIFTGTDCPGDLYWNN